MLRSLTFFFDQRFSIFHGFALPLLHVTQLFHNVERLFCCSTVENCCNINLFFLSAEEGEEGEEDSPLSYDKLIMPGIKFKVFSLHILPVSNKARSRNCFCV